MIGTKKNWTFFFLNIFMKIKIFTFPKIYEVIIMQNLSRIHFIFSFLQLHEN